MFASEQILYKLVRMEIEDNMKKRTINRILLGMIAFFLVAICVLIVQIVSRPRYLNIEETENTMITEATAENNVQTASALEASATSETATSQNQVQRGKTSTKVNIRELDNADSRVLETVEAGYEFEILQIQDNGWTKIKYQDTEAYISSLYVILIQNTSE